MNLVNFFRQALNCCSLPLYDGKKRLKPLPIPFEGDREAWFAQIVKNAYAQNVKTIFDAQGANGCFISKNNQLVYRNFNEKFSNSELEKGIALTKQVLRQAWGEVVGAQMGVNQDKSRPLLLEEAIHRVDELQTKLRSVLSSNLAEKILTDDKWPLIKADNYRATTSDIVQHLNDHQPTPKTEREARSRKDLLEFVTVRLLKREEMLYQTRFNNKKEYTFEPFAENQGGVNLESTVWVKKGDQVIGVSKNGSEEVKWEYSSHAWVNELIGAAFDQLSGCKFGCATSAVISDTEGNLRTVHSFKQSKGHWTRHHNEFVDPIAAQSFIVYNILLKTQDCHERNILRYRKGNFYYPIPIDLGRMLSPCPEKHATGMFRFMSFVNWRGLSYLIDPSVQDYINKLDANKIVSSIGKMFENHPWITPRMGERIKRKLEHLRANIIMVKEAIKMDLTPLELIALSTFKLNEEDLDVLEDIISREGEKSITLDLRTYVLKNCYSGFLTAWNAAVQAGTLNEEVFTLTIREAMKKIKQTEADEEYFNERALDVYDRMKV